MEHSVGMFVQNPINNTVNQGSLKKRKKKEKDVTSVGENKEKRIHYK